MSWRSFIFNRTQVFGALLCLTLTTACGPKIGDDNSVVSYRPEGTEASYSSSISYTPGTTIQIQGQANYARYDDYSNAGAQTGLGTIGSPQRQGLVNTQTKPIRRAEVVITNSSGTVVQAGHTDNSGAIDLSIPNVAGTYKVEVRSRADNTYLKASVLTNPYDKAYYAVSQNVTVPSGLTAGSNVTIASTILAPHNGNAEGGAFNILENALLANEYLRNHAKVVSSSSSPDYCPSAVCGPDFTVAPKVQIYWTRGLSPAAYYGSPSSPISFFTSNSGGGIYPGIYILGGIEGSVCADTDHFDNSVVLHEYAHYLESVYASSDSPGGSHNGNRIIDPRLAWSEGWANFFQAAVLGRAIYRDTQRNADCPALSSSGTYYTARLSFTDFNIETQLASQDQPSVTGEGNFREISVSRVLWDSLTGPTQASPHDADTDSTNANLGFAVLWEAFKGLSSSVFSARNVGHFHINLYNKLNTASFGSTYLDNWRDDTYASNARPLVREKQHRDLRDFGLPLTPRAVAHGSCPANADLANYTGPDWIFTTGGPVKDTMNGSGYITYSDMFNSNDMYRHYYDGTSATATIKLHYKKWTGDGSGLSQPWDLDLYVYKKSFVFLNSSDIVKSSEQYYPETSNPNYATETAGGYPGYEVVDLTGLSSGYYYINVKVFYQGTVTVKAGTQYYLETGTGAQLCP